MDIQAAALAKAIVVGDLRLLVDARITTEFFPDEKYSKVYQFLLDHWTSYAVPPNEAVVKQSFPNLVLADIEQPTTYVIDQLRERRESVMQMQALQEASAILADPDEPAKVLRIREVLHNHLVSAQLETSGTRDTDIVTTYESILDRLNDRRDNPGYLRGYSTGFKGIDFVTGGLQDEQFVVLTGVPKSGKSSIMLYIALALHRQGLVPMFVGFEMSNVEQEDRLVSLLSGVSLTKILNGTTSLAEFLRVGAALRLLKDMQPFFFSADITSGMTVSGVQAKIQKYNPAAVFIDGAYLMSAGDDRNFPPGTEGAIRRVSRDLKKLAQSARKPVVVTTQSLLSRSRGGLTTGSIGYTSAFGQDADLLLGAERQPDSNITKLHVLDSRSGPRADTWIEWDWDRGYVGEIDAADFTPAAKKSRKENFDD